MFAIVTPTHTYWLDERRSIDIVLNKSEIVKDCLVELRQDERVITLTDHVTLKRAERIREDIVNFLLRVQRCRDRADNPKSNYFPVLNINKDNVCFFTSEALGS